MIPPHPLNNFEIQKCYQNGPRFDGVYSRDNLPDKIKDGPYVTNLDEYSDIGTIGLLCMQRIIMLLILIAVLVSNIFQKENKTFIDKSIVVTNIFRIQAYESVWIFLYWIY